MVVVAGLCSQDADEGVVVDEEGGGASCSAQDAWLGVRGRPGVMRGAYQYEVELDNECLLRVGWAAAAGRRAVGTDARSFGYGGTGMKSTSGKFEPYGENFEASTGAVVTCLVDRRQARGQSISYCLNGKSLGVAFRLEPWLADVALFPALCGREDWKARCRFRGLKYPQPGFTALGEAKPDDVVDGLSAEAAKSSAQAFAPAPSIGLRELKQFDVPDENLLEFRGPKGVLELAPVQRWLAREHDLQSSDFHCQISEDGAWALLAFSSHRTARGVLAAPPRGIAAGAKAGFSVEARDLLRKLQPRKGATTDAVARRLIAGALEGDAVMTKEQIRQLRARKLNADDTGGRRPPPAPPMPEISSDRSATSGDEAELESPSPAPAQAASPSPPPRAREAPPAKRAAPDGKVRCSGGSRLLAGALQGLGAAGAPRRGPRNALG